MSRRLGGQVRTRLLRQVVGPHRTGTARAGLTGLAGLAIGLVTGVTRIVSGEALSEVGLEMAKRGGSEASAAAAPFVAARASCRPHTNPAARHCSTIDSKTRLNTWSAYRCRIQLGREWSESGSVTS